MARINDLNILTRQFGFTLVEVMVAITISSILMIGVVQILQSNRLTYRTIEGNSIVQENGRIGIEILRQSLRMAAFRNDPRLDEQNAFGNFPTGIAGIANTIVSGTDDTGPNSSDQITVRYYGLADCVGNTLGNPTGTVIAGTAGASLVTSTFNIQTGADGRPALFCNGTELLEGVDSLQIQYGVDPDGDSSVNQYLAAGAVGNMAQVVTLRFSILVATSTQYASYQDTTDHVLLNTTISAQNDLRVRRVYSATTQLRNRCSLMSGIRC